MKKTIKFLLVLSCVLALVFSCKSKKTDAVAEQPVDEPVVNEVAAQETQVAAEPINIAFGDFDAMFAFSKQAQNGELTEGQIVTIDGELSNNFGVSIGQRKGDEYFGTTLEVEGWEKDSENFPADRSRVKVTAKVVRNKDFFFEYLVANPADFTVIEAATEE